MERLAGMIKPTATGIVCLVLISVCVCDVLDISEDTVSVCNMYDPGECKLETIELQFLKTVEDFDKCGPALLPEEFRNYYFAPSGRRLTYLANLNSFKSGRRSWSSRCASTNESSLWRYALSLTAMQDWHKLFREGRESFKDDELMMDVIGLPSSSWTLWWSRSPGKSAQTDESPSGTPPPGIWEFAIVPRMLRDVSNADTSVTVLGERISAPIGLSPAAQMKLAHPDGEVAAVRAAVKEGSVMILSTLASVTLEEVAEAANEASDGRQPVLWMQTYIFRDRQETLQIVHRAERAGFKAIVATVDSPISGINPCNDRDAARHQSFPNINDPAFEDNMDASLTFDDLTWLAKNTELPVVAKGILSGRDAMMAAKAGAAAILVSNHGGRQLDSDPPTINVLPEIARTLKACCPSVEVYMDGGVRNGFDMYKAIARGARAVFIGRPTVWGLAVAGEDGVRKVLSILKTEFNTTMLLAGSPKPSDITEDTVVPGLFS